MVSSTSTSAQKPALSYADSARKAQGIRSTTSPATHRRPQHNPSAPLSAATVAPRANSTSADPPSTSIRPSENVSPLPTMTEPVQPSKGSNGDLTHATVEPVAGSSFAPVTMAKKSGPPSVNVWAVRASRMAQAHAQSLAQPHPPRTSESVSQRPSDNARETGAPAVPEDLNLKSTSPPDANGSQKIPASEDVSVAQSVESSTPPPKSAKFDDPWSVRQGTESQTPPSLPHLDDVAEWPEVGTILSGGPNISGEPAEQDKDSKEEEQEEREPTPRKNEKTKWVAIPAEELQAAADAQRSRHPRKAVQGRVRPHNSSESRVHGGAQSSASTSASPSASGSTAPSVAGGSNSKSHSRAQSTARERQSTSRAPSVPQSQTQSRTGSVHSSPKNNASRSKRLPDELPGATTTAPAASSSAQNRSSLSSRAPSPQSQSRSFPPVAVNPGMPVSITPVANVSVAPVRGDSPRQPYVDGRGSPYYHIPAPSYSPYPLPASSSPSAAPYPPVVPGFPASPVPIPPPFPGAAPYPTYNPYSYPYAAPYPPYWAPAGTPDSSSPYHHPMLPPHPAQYPPSVPDKINQSVHASPLTPSASLPPNTEKAAQPSTETECIMPAADQPQQDSKEKRRKRVLSFGSIVVTGTGLPVTPSPGTPAPDNSAPTMDQQQINSSATNGSADKTASDSTGVQESNSSPIAGGSADSAESETSVSSSRATELPGHEPKWEFGTTQHPEIEDQPVYSLDKATASSVNDGPAESHPQNVTITSSDVVVLPVEGVATRSRPIERTSEDPFTIKNYGYGFGRRAIQSVNGGPPPKTEEQSHWREKEKDSQPGTSGRPRRGSANGYDRGYDRGYSGRGRGRGRGYRGYYGRGGGQRQYPPGPSSGYPVQPKITTEIEDDTVYYAQSPLMQFAQPYEQYSPYPSYPPPPVTFSGIPPPAPVTKINFPLDPLSYYVLGQLEYYLGADNLAHDLFLRKKMDSRGWIPILVLASFNRVRSLTGDQQHVKYALSLSSLAEVRGEWVRVHRWQQWVLPTAPESTVEPTGLTPNPDGDLELSNIDQPDDGASRSLEHEGAAEYVPQEGVAYPLHEGHYPRPPYEFYPQTSPYASAYATEYGVPPQSLGVPSQPAEVASPQSAQREHKADLVLDEEESEELESDESDVEFVLGKDANGSWTPERKQG